MKQSPVVTIRVEGFIIMLFTERDYYEDVVAMLNARGVELKDIAELVLFGQRAIIPDLTMRLIQSNTFCTRLKCKMRL